MSDSIDRVFAHALQTVRKIPRVSASSSHSHNGANSTPQYRRPPSEDRLRLYGLYKQSMEGDVLGVMERPTGSSLDADKWDAWNAMRGVRRTEAKRRYIECLIETMKKYASDTPEARGLVSELEFVWDQVKWNTHSAKHSISSNPKKETQIQRYAQPPAEVSGQQQQQQQQLQQGQVQMQMAGPGPGGRRDSFQQQQLQQVQIQHHQQYSSRPPSPANLPLSMYRQEPSRAPDYLGHGDEYTGYQSSSGEQEHLINPGRVYYEEDGEAGGAGGGGGIGQKKGEEVWPVLRRMKVGSRGTRSMISGDEEGEEMEDGGEDEEGLESEEEEEESEDDGFFEHSGLGVGNLVGRRFGGDGGGGGGGGGIGDREEEGEEEEEPGHLILGRDTASDIGTMRWQLRVERALAKMASEISALREQLDVSNTRGGGGGGGGGAGGNHQTLSSWFWSHHNHSHPDSDIATNTTINANTSTSANTNTHHLIFGHGVGGSGTVGSGSSLSRDAAAMGHILGRKIFGRAAWRVVWTVLRHLMVDAVVVGIVVFWMGRRGDRRAGEVGRWVSRLVGRRKRDGGLGGGGEGMK